MIHLVLPGVAYGGGGYVAGRMGHVLGKEIFLHVGPRKLPCIPHHWIPGAAALGYGAVAGMPLLACAGAGMVISDWDDLVAGRFFGASPADTLPHHMRTFWGLD